MASRLTREELVHLDYKLLQQIAKQNAIPCNIRRRHLEEAVYLRFHGSSDDVEAALDRANRERIAEKRKKDKMISKHCKTTGEPVVKKKLADVSSGQNVTSLDAASSVKEEPADFGSHHDVSSLRDVSSLKAESSVKTEPAHVGSHFNVSSLEAASAASSVKAEPADVSSLEAASGASSVKAEPADVSSHCDVSSLEAASSVKTDPADFDEIYTPEEETAVKEEMDIEPTVIQRPDFYYVAQPCKSEPVEEAASGLSVATSCRSGEESETPDRSRKTPSSRDQQLLRMAVGERSFESIRAGFLVHRTPSGTLRPRDDNRPLVRTTPGGTVGRVTATRSLGFMNRPEERGDAAQTPDDEVAETLASTTWHLERWLEDLPRVPIAADSTTGDAVDPVEAVPSAVNQETAAAAEQEAFGEGSSSALKHLPPPLQRAASPVAGPSVERRSASPVVGPSVERRSASPVVGPSVERRAASPVAGPTGERSSGMGRVHFLSEDGSVVDSEDDDVTDDDVTDDDEFDAPNRVAPTPGGTESPSAAVADADVAAVMTAADEAINNAQDDLPDVDFNFEWSGDYNSFRGARGVFNGGPAGPIRPFDTPYDAFVAIWDENIMRTIATQTNNYAWQIICKRVAEDSFTHSNRLKEWDEVEVDELYVLLGMYIIMGFTPRLRLDDYWKTSRFFDNPGIRSVMSYNRYILLNKFLHFVDSSVSVTHDRKRLSKLQPIIDHCNAKFQELYVLGEHVSIDESLTLWKGRLSWAQCIRTKAAKFNIKSFELCESLTGYLWRFVIYTGKGSAQVPSSAVADIAGKTTDIVLDLLRGLEFKGYYLTMDNFYNSPILARYLKTRGFDCVGTLRTIRKHVPDAVKLKKSVADGTLVSRHSGDVSITSRKDSKVVSTISTLHDAGTYETTKRVKGRGVVPVTKLIVVRDYNKYMGGIDLKDEKLAMYLMEPKRGVKWYIKMFKRLLNVSVHNAYVLYRKTAESQGRKALTHRQFREDLATALVDNHTRREPRVRTNPKELRLRTDVCHCPVISTRNLRKLCARCKKRSKYLCDTCGRGLCLGECWRDWHTKADLK